MLRVAAEGLTAGRTGVWPLPPTAKRQRSGRFVSRKALKRGPRETPTQGTVKVVRSGTKLARRSAKPPVKREQAGSGSRRRLQSERRYPDSKKHRPASARAKTIPAERSVRRLSSHYSILLIAHRQYCTPSPLARVYGLNRPCGSNRQPPMLPACTPPQAWTESGGQRGCPKAALY